MSSSLNVYECSSRCSSVRGIACERLRCEGKLAQTIVGYIYQEYKLLKETLSLHSEPLTDKKANVGMFDRVRSLTCSLELFSKACKLDPIIAEELTRELRCNNRKLVRSLEEFNADQYVDDEDSIIAKSMYEMHDAALEVIYSCKGKTVQLFSDEDLVMRLPLVFSISSCVKEEHKYNVLINQVSVRQSAQDDVGFVMWPSAVVLSNWIASNPDYFAGYDVIEIGSGCGLSGLAAACMDANKVKSVLLTDFNDKVLENLLGNISINALEDRCNVDNLDFYAQEGNDTNPGWINGSGERCTQFQRLIAADIICKPEDAVAAANTCYDVLCPGGLGVIICGNSNHRYGVDIFEKECIRAGLNVEVKDSRDIFDGRLLCSKSLGMTSGFVDGMSLVFFFLSKPER